MHPVLAADFEVDLTDFVDELGESRGFVYLIHFEQPYKHARHYCGWASDLGRRIGHHRAGSGGNLLRVVNNAGIAWHVVRVWTDADRHFERRLKNRGGLARECPVCGFPRRY